MYSSFFQFIVGCVSQINIYNDPPRGLVVSVFVPGVDRSQISLQVFKSENYLEVEVSPSTCDKSVFITQEW